MIRVESSSWCVAFADRILTGGGHLLYRQTLTCEQGFVEGKQNAFDDLCIGRDAVTFVKHDNILGHHFPSWNPPSAFRPDHKCARTGEVAERFQGALGSLFLHHGDSNYEEDAGKNRDRFSQIPNQ